MTGADPPMPPPESLVVRHPRCPRCQKSDGVPLIPDSTVDYYCLRCKHVWVVLRQPPVTPRPSRNPDKQ